MKTLQVHEEVNGAGEQNQERLGADTVESEPLVTFFARQEGQAPEVNFTVVLPRDDAGEILWYCEFEPGAILHLVEQAKSSGQRLRDLIGNAFEATAEALQAEMAKGARVREEGGGGLGCRSSRG